MSEDERAGVVGEVKKSDEPESEGSAPKEVLAAGGVSKSRRTGSGHSRYGHRRSPTTGHRVRRNKTPEPDFVPVEIKSAEEKKERTRRSKSTPGEVRGENGRSRISSSEEEKEQERKPRKITKTKSDSVARAQLDGSKKGSGVSLTSKDSNSTAKKPSEAPPKPALRTRSKSRGREENGKNGEEKEASWWKSWPGWTQKLRGKSLERDSRKEENKLVAPPRRNRSLERPPVIREKEKRAALKKEKETLPVPKKRSKSKSRTSSDDDKERRERRPSVEESSDEFWKSSDGVRKRKVEKSFRNEVLQEKLPPEAITHDDLSKQLVLVGTIIESNDIELEKVKEAETEDVKNEKYIEGRDRFFKIKALLKEFKSISVREFIKEVRTEWNNFLNANPHELQKIKSLCYKCIASFVILVMYCGTGAMIFRFTEGAFENFYKCGVKRVKREFVDALWLSSHNLREEDWKSLARRKLMEFEEQLHTAHEAGMTSYSGLKAWSFLNAFLYCLTVVSTIGYGHISPSTTTGRAITIIYAIFGIPMFLILLADFGKLFTRGIKFIWAFVRRVYYTGSCKKVRRTAHVQEVMKGVQMVYDIATFRRPSQLPPGVTLDDAPPVGLPAPPLPPRPAFTPGEPPGTPAPSTFAIDDEFNLPISVAIFILLIYIFCGATVFYVWESWGFFESFYFVFISMSTIGFGDFVPQNQMYMMASIVYLVFGLALTSMCINVVQEKLSDSFRQASAKIGATIGLRVAEEDGAITPVAPAPVEIAEVHNAVSNKTTPTLSPS